MSEVPAQASIQAKFRLDYPQFTLDFGADIPGRGVTALFGPSGSGKTTALRCVAGLIRAPGGRLVIGDEIWQDETRGFFLPTHRRPLGMVFQDAALFPHLTVLGNLNYGMKRSGTTKASASFDAILALLGIEGLLDRMPGKLSGGERQRVAVARALLMRPRLVLMDEPLAALDLKRKLEILPYLERLRDELDIPILYVSHSPDEVARLADHLILMDTGRIVASGPLSQTLGRVDLPSAFADDAGVVLSVIVAQHEVDELTRLEFDGGAILVSRRLESVGRRLRCRIHARDVSLAIEPRADTSILNILPAMVVAFAQTGTPGHVLVQLSLRDGAPLLARITERSRRQLGVTVGSAVWAQVKAVALLGE
ncbi:molybdenum ABC transporter ATP-binding protein [Methylocystis rosea]|uniref:Molybdenum ABC transporter ATP-binding protein n=1 Tax=Methylocystis rosea TaxID=173366 RepID=A0A3G8MC13_9HYPH|nr:molybdenum ABC transporter ATP-binding protein [Methylocystis rosea]AZG78815.1 molybdenum ABC transporter ATP-binding protein [Methylocystis rosea]